MNNNLIQYRLARIHLNSGEIRILPLSQVEILNLATAMSTATTTGLSHITLYYDGPDKKISWVLTLNSIAALEVDDRYLTDDGLDEIEYEKWRIWQEPGFFKKLKLKIKKWRKKRQSNKENQS